MNTKATSKTQLIKELKALRRRIAEMEAAENEWKQIEHELCESQERLLKAEKVAHLGSWEMDIATGESKWSDEFYRICGLEPGAVKASAEEGFKLIHPEDRPRASKSVSQAIEAGGTYNIEKRIVRPDGNVRYVQSIGEIVADAQGQPQKLVGSFLDITERKEADITREQLIERLQTALAEVKLLSGLLPICASCKKIRDTQGHWHQVEVYIRDHSEAEFSHSLCPGCAETLYPELRSIRKNKPSN